MKTAWVYIYRGGHLLNYWGRGQAYCFDKITEKLTSHFPIVLEQMTIAFQNTRGREATTPGVHHWVFIYKKSNDTKKRTTFMSWSPVDSVVLCDLSNNLSSCFCRSIIYKSNNNTCNSEMKKEKIMS